MRRQHPAPQLRLSASSLFRRVGTTLGCAHAPYHVPPAGHGTCSRAGHCQSPQHRASSAPQSCTQNSSLGWQVPSLFSHISLVFPFFSWPTTPLQSSRNRTQSSNSGTHIGQASFCAALWVELLILLIN